VRKYQQMILVTIFVFVVAAVVMLRLESHHDEFKQESLKIKAQTQSYDQDFIAMVDRLEAELAERASFPYLGGKDPMTGKVRTVVAPPPATQSNKPITKTVEQKAAVPEPGNDSAVVDVPEIDPVRLTAILFDDFKKVFSAIMMVKERSYSVEVGDKIHNRTVKSISANLVVLESDQRTYQYNISGEISNRVK